MSASPAVKITLRDGKERSVYFSYTDLRLIREKYGVSFAKGTGYENVDEDTLPEILLIGLHDEAMTLDQLLSLMDGEQTNEYFATVIRAGNGKDVMDAFVALKNVNGRLDAPKAQTTETAPSQS